MFKIVFEQTTSATLGHLLNFLEAMKHILLCLLGIAALLWPLTLRLLLLATLPVPL